MLHADDVAIADPCGEDWQVMEDHGRFRHCARCDKPVYDFSQHSEREIRALVAARVCRRVGFYADGTIVTREPSVVPASRLIRFARVAALALPLAGCDQSRPHAQTDTPPTTMNRLDELGGPGPAATLPPPADFDAPPAPPPVLAPSASAAPPPSPAPSASAKGCLPNQGTKHTAKGGRSAGRKVVSWDLGSQR